MTVLLFVCLAAPGRLHGQVVISQAYGGGGNAGAIYRNDFVELFNRGTTTVSLSGWSVQYATSTGTGSFASYPIAILSGSLEPGQYYLVQLASGGTTGVSLPTPDATGQATMGSTSGKVVLVSTTTGLPCNGGTIACPPEEMAKIIDLVGYGSATFFEGAGPAPGTNNATAVCRAADGCTDSNNNAADFVATAPNPRNTASPRNRCFSVADFDGDRDVDLADFGPFQACFNGPNRPPAQSCAVSADFDGDDDVDLTDFLVFQNCFNGPNRPPACQ